MKNQAPKISFSLTLVLLMLSLFGCSRKMDPKTADLEVQKLLQDVPGFNWEPHENSRLRKLSKDEFPMIPSDDPDSRKVTERIQRADAYKDGNLSTPLEPSEWRTFLPHNQKGEIALDLENSMSLAVRHSRELQSQKEALYLTALDVTFERFRLGPRPFAGISGETSKQGKEEFSDFKSRLTVGGQGVAGMGSNWVLSLANRLSVGLSGGDVEVGGSMASLALTQPLLRGASRRIYLESLTQQERRLLYNARNLEQFRQGFYLDVVLGVNPSRGVGATSSISMVSPPAVGVSGFLGLVLELQRIRNQEANVAKLRESLEQLEAAFEAGRIGSRLQVDQARQALFSGQSRLLASRSSFENRLDGYKLFLGLPADLPMVVTDQYVESFRLNDPVSSKIQDEVNKILNRVRDFQNADSLRDLREQVGRALKFEQQAKSILAGVGKDVAIFEKVIPLRKKGFEQLRARPDLQELGMSVDTFNHDDLPVLLQDLRKAKEKIKENLLDLFSELREWQKATGQNTLILNRSRAVDLLSDLSDLFLELSLTRASARLESIVLDYIKISPKEAYGIASNHRLDWKNARAKLVDMWRDVDIARDDLRTDLDLVLSGDLGSDSMGAGQFRPDESRVSVGIEIDTPLAKIKERNKYKASLVRYEQSRRDFLAYQDSILRGFREHQRLSNLFQLNFELSRAAVRGAIAQVDLARMRLGEPPKPGRNSQFGATTARDLVNALNDLLDASNRFVEVWIGYEAMRMRLAYDLGTMELTESGLWVKP
jgi:hypothetical protein